MQPQGASVFNAAYLAHITQQINGIADNVNLINPCALIQQIVDEAMTELQTEINAIEAQIGSLSILVEIPTDLGGVIRWITNFVGPSNKALLNYIQQLVQMVGAITQLIAAIEAAANRLTQCQINISAPVISVPLPSINVQGTSNTTAGVTGVSSAGSVTV